MWNNKNNITLSLKNIISFSRNITSHFTGKAKIITLVLVIIMLSFINITLSLSNAFYNSNVSALSYSSNVGVGFTFNPTLSVSISPSNLVIDNLTPGTTGDSNTINVLVATNAAYGYTLSAIMNGNNNNLTHTNGTNTFSSIATDSSLSNLTTDNTWGYSYKNNLASSPTWSSYSGLSNSANKVLFNTDSNSGGSIDFKIAAKASETQPSGTYTGTINFTATTKPMPKTIEDIAYMQTFAELDTTDLASVKSSMTLNSAYILKDVRDEKEYYVTRLEDGNVWMTQNLDLDLDSNRSYTHYDTDLGWDDPNNLDINATWQPIHSTIDFTDGAVDGWVDSNTKPYSADPGDIYYYTSGNTNMDILYSSLEECADANHSDCKHYHAGNYYNWSSAVANNDTSSMTSGNAPNSICPSGWRLPSVSNNDFGKVLYASGIINSVTAWGNNAFTENGFINIRRSPMFLTRVGELNNKKIINAKTRSYYYSSTALDASLARILIFWSGYIDRADNQGRQGGRLVRCLAR